MPTPNTHISQLLTCVVTLQITIETTFTSLTIREVTAATAGTYSVVARNLGGEARTSCVLDTTAAVAARKAPPAMQPRIMQPLQNKDAMEGSSARLDCVIVGQPEPEVSRHQAKLFRNCYVILLKSWTCQQLISRLRLIVYRRIRGREVTAAIEQCRLDIRKFLF